MSFYLSYLSGHKHLDLSLFEAFANDKVDLTEKLKLGSSVGKDNTYTNNYGFIFSNHSQEHSLSFSPKLVNLNVTTSDWLNLMV